MARTIRSQTTLQRALLPVAGGIVFFAVLGLLTWGVAALLADHPEQVNERLASTTFEVGDIEAMSALIEEDGPLIFHDLVDAGGKLSVVLDHAGTDPRNGWVVYFAYPAGGDPACKVVQVRGTRDFTDCTGAKLDVSALAPAAGVLPFVQGDTIAIDLRRATSGTGPSPSTS
jgi:hypothetical protein